ncbi:MAG: DNA primase [Magnetospirillum sp.]|nr:DNA primase [Magnetospirillum sp.]
MLAPSFLDDLKSRVSVSSVVTRRTVLTKAGREFHGLCPFHNEKTPSFTVNDDKGFFHCFGCGAHGGIIDFEMRAYGLSFLDAVERLAAEAGLEVPKASPEEREHEARRATLYEAMEAACVLFEENLRKPQGNAGLEYLLGRGVSEDSIARFRVGWAPERDGLKSALMGSRFPEALLLEAGLLRQREDGSTGDLFRGRVTFPITDRRGRVIAFGARTLGDGQPKYLNSPATPIFDKGAVLYGFAHAREGAAKEGVAAVVEGYLDVVAMHQADLAFAVAPLGTALTERQLEQLWALAAEPVLCMDGDSAGQRAMERACERALPMLAIGRTLRFAVLPAKEDPDSLIRASGPDAMRGALSRARPLSDVVWQLSERRFPPETPERLAAFEAELFTRASVIPDGRARRHMLGEFRRRLRWGYEAPAPDVLLGRSKKRTAPLPGVKWLANEWERARREAEAGPVREWIERQGVDWQKLVSAWGGVGFARGKAIKGKYPEGMAWAGAPPPSLWEPEDGAAGLVIIPEWEGAPGQGAPLDLVAWNPRTGDLASRTGRAVVLGENAVAESLDFEGRGLTRPVKVAESPLSWLRMTADGDGAVLVVDWRRVWDVLGGVSALVGETVELAEQLHERVRPPRLRCPTIMVEGGEGIDGQADQA